MERTEILSFGIIAIDDTYTLDGLPEPDTKTTYISTRRTGGGQSATALVAAARLGCSCRWVGHLGDNDLSAFARMIYAREGIAFDAETPRPEAEPAHSIILSDIRNGSRTLMSNMDRVTEFDIGVKELAMIDAACCLFVDQCLPKTQLAATRRAAASGVPVVSDIENLRIAGIREMAELSDHFIVPAALAPEMFGEADPARALAKALQFGRKSLVCMTDGERGSWFATADKPGEVRHQPAFAVRPVVDTNGCGDVFHGAYAASLVKGFSRGECIRRAAAAAALKVRKPGGQEGAPTLEELEAFLAGM